MKDQQVGDALVFGERQTERRFGLGARLRMAVHTVGVAVDPIDVTVNSIDMTVDAVHSIRDVVSCTDEFAFKRIPGGTLPIQRVSACDSTILLLLLLLQLIVLIQVDVWRLHSDDGLV